jgi:hypothetical protein
MAISIEGLRILRLLKKTAAVYLLLLFLDRPLRVTDAARLLEIDRETARKHLLSPADDRAVWDTLGAAGITRNARTEQLARRDFLTPDYVTGHFLSLKRRGKADQTGLLVTILESGAPAPALNANHHLKDCDCSECRMLKYRICPYCGEYPCECEEEG